ncbi:MAG: methyltransferase domain-containing protein [candidate division WOR-3 bacterium]|nr:methyltransferase domain-containing protein [candidate division WOR-3 bacterium]
MPLFDFEAVFEPKDYLYFYQDFLTEKRTKSEVEFLIRELKLDKAMKILDLACGYGRHSNRLAKLGYNVTGVDINKGFLEIARREAKQMGLSVNCILQDMCKTKFTGMDRNQESLKIVRNEARQTGLSVNYIQQDMRKINFKNEFDRIILMFTSFGYFNDAENFKVLKNICQALKSKGLFCFDTFHRDVLLRNFLPYIVFEKGKDLMIDRNQYDKKTKRIYNNRIVIRDGKRKDKPFFVRLYNPAEIKTLLSEVGMYICKMFSDWDSSPFSSNSKRMIIIAEKK